MSWLGVPAPPTSLRHRRRGGSSAAASDEPGVNGASRPRRKRHKPAARDRSRERGARGWVREGFRRFGEHCARNQIRTLLIDCLVMTNLFYPSLAAYLERQFDAAPQPTRAPAPGSPTPRGPLAIFTRPLSETFFPAPPPLLPNVDWGPWWANDGASAWIASQPVAQAQPVDIDVLRVAWADVGDVLDGEPEGAKWSSRDTQIVAEVRRLAETWETDARCVRHLVEQGGKAVPKGRCYLLSSEAASIQGATPVASLAGDLEAGTETYRGVLVPFHSPPYSANRTAFEAEWTRRLADAIAPLGAEVFTETYPRGTKVESAPLVSYSASPRELAPAPIDITSRPPRFVLFLYAVLFLTLLYQLSNATKVHSRFGLAFTGIVQLCCSAVMSFSVLALLGWNGWGWGKGQTVLPTYALPFVIVVVGAENMSTLTKAVFSVPFNHSVPVRIGMGLSKAGATISITSLIDLGLLGLVWLCVHLQPVREFCIFAAVVIVTDWFMLHTFFLTVLSIDAQRLELADVLASNGGLSSSEAQRREEEASRRARKTRLSWRSVLRARTAKSGSLILLLTSVAVLYYYTERGRSTLNTAAAFYGYTPPTTTTSSYAHPTMYTTSASELSSLSASEAFWRAINPRGFTSVRISLPPSSIAIFPRVGHSMSPADIHKLSIPRRAFKLPTLGPLWYFFKVVVVPQGLTALALYSLLLYLLKDSDLLAAQRNRLGRGREANASDEETDDGSTPLKSGKTTFAATFSVYMLPASHEMDVDVLVSSKDGRLALSVGVDNSVCLWRFTPDDQCAGTREMVPTSLPGGDPIVGAAVSSDRTYIAVATRRGAVQLWSCPEEGKTESLGTVDTGCRDGRLVALAFDDVHNLADDPFTASPVSAQGQRSHPALLVALSSGAVKTIKAGMIIAEVVPPVEADLPCKVDMFTTAKGPEIVICAADGITRWTRQHGEWIALPLASSLEHSDRVLTVSRATVTWHDAPADIVVLGRRSGYVEVFDENGEAIGMGQAGDAVRSVAIAAPSTTRCTTCDQPSSDGFFVVSSTASQVFVDRVVPRVRTNYCRCAPTRRASILDDGGLAAGILMPVVLPPSPARGRYRSNGYTASINASPMKSASLVPPTNGDFPLSSHGVRRLSGWRPEEERRPPSPLDRSSSFTALNSLAMSAVDDSGSSAATPAPERSQWSDVEIIPLGGIRAVDGGWAVVDNALVGVRRALAGIDDSQWQLWALDLTAAWNGTTLNVDNVTLEVLERRSRQAPSTPRVSEELPMRTRRAERMLSLTGRASFPSSMGSFSVPTHSPLGYVAVRPFRAAGRAALAGFGNRVGIITQPAHKVPAIVLPSAAPPISISITTPRRAFPTPPPPPRRSTDGASGPGLHTAPSSPSKNC